MSIDLNDSDFANEVRTALHAGTSQVTTSPALLPDLHKSYRRRIAVRRTTFTAVPLTIAAIVAVAAFQSAARPTSPQKPPVAVPPQATTAQSPQVTTQPRIINVAYVTAQVAKAMDDVEEYVVHTRVNGDDTLYGPGSINDTWARGDSTVVHSIISISGKPVAEWRGDPQGWTAVDHRERTYSRDIEEGPQNPAKGPGRYDVGILTPDMIKKALRDGRLSIVDTAQTGGRSIIHLRGDNVLKASPPIGVWIDETTYLPTAVEYFQEGKWEPRTELTWLPPTQTNLALLNLVIPPGFTEE